MLIVYVETSVWSFAIANDVPELTAATHLFFDACRAGRLQAVIGPPVIDEINRADPPVRAQLSSLIEGITPLRIPASPTAARLAAEFLRLGAVPPSKPDDAAHVAYAFAAEVDVLASWNFKHIANVRRAEKFNAIALLNHYRKRLSITSPNEVLYDEP